MQLINHGFSKKTCTSALFINKNYYVQVCGCLYVRAFADTSAQAEYKNVVFSIWILVNCGYPKINFETSEIGEDD
jgi:hypothetical protein